MAEKKESGGERFGWVGDVGGFLLSAADKYGEQEMRRMEVKNAANAQSENNQQPQPVNTNGAPVETSEKVFDAKTALFVGGGVLAVLGSVYLLTKNKSSK